MTSLDRAEFPHFTEVQWSALERMQGIIGPDGIADLLAQDAETQISRVDRFVAYERTLLEHLRGELVQQQQAATAPPPPPVVVTTRPSVKPLHLKVDPFMGDEDGERLLLWVREVEMAMMAALLTDDRLKVAFAVSQLGGRARSWALTRAASVADAFPTWEQLKYELELTFQPPNSAYRVRSRFLACRQGKRTLADYVQELRTLSARMVADPLPEVVKVTIFMEGLNVGPARTQLFRSRVGTLEEAVRVALEEDYCHRQSRISAGVAAQSVANDDGPQPMELGSAEQRRAPVQCFACGRFGHYQRNCPARGNRPRGGRAPNNTRAPRASPPNESRLNAVDTREGGADTQGNECSQ